MASDTSLIFNLIAKDKASKTLENMKEKISTAAAGIGAGAAAGIGAGIAASLDVSAASDKLAAQLGVGPAKAAELSKVSANVYKQAWGDSIETVNDAVKGVYQNIGNTSAAKGGLEGLTSKALALAQTFDQDVGGVTMAVGQMLKTGLARNADEAFDIVTSGFQRGVNKADDFLDTLNEYGTQFRKFGLDGKTATGLLAQGLKGGARDADLVADAIKEFSIRAIDGSATTKTGFDAIGLSASQMAAKIGKGGSSASKALDLTLDRLRSIKDPVQREAAAVALFGTQAEDLGKALFSLDPSKAVQALGKVGGAADRMSKQVGDNPKQALEKFKREATMKLADIGGQFVQFGMKHQQYAKPLIISLGVIAGLILVTKGAMMAWTAAQAIWTGVTATATAAQWLFNAALMANPLGLLLIAIIGVGVGLVVLWKKSETFRDIVKGSFNAVWSAIKWVWDWTKKNWPLLLAILAGPFGVAVYLITKNWDKIKHGGQVVWRWLSGLPGKIKSGFSKVGGWISAPFRAGFNAVARGWNSTVGRLSFRVPSWVPGLGGAGWSMPRLPMLAKGGMIRGAGMAIVGEAGPELVHLPAGAAVSPLGRGGVAEVRVVLDARGADRATLTFLRSLVRVYGQGSPEKAFAPG